MSANRKISITLPDDVADDVRHRVASGSYASEGDVLRAGMRALADREQAGEDRFAMAVKAQYAAFEAGTLETIAFEDYTAELAEDRAAGR